MYYKPKHTYLDKPALHYKKIIDLAKYNNTQVYFNVYNEEYYIYDRETTNGFVKLDEKPNGQEIWVSPLVTYCFGDKYYYYGNDETWKTISQEDIYGSVITITDSNVYKGQKNRYIKDREFDYTTISDINESEQQIHKGLISSTKSFDIRYTDDDINLKDEDIVQIENELFFVSECSYKIVRLPNPYKTYFCTLTRIKR
jgi:hypothetical protein